MDAQDCELRQRVEQLARELHDTRREVERLRRRRRVAPAVALVLCGAGGWTLGLPATSAQGTPSRVVAPFTIVDEKGQELVSVTAAEGFARMRVGAQGGNVWLGTGASRAGFLTVQRQDGTNAVALGQIGSGPSGVHVMDAGGKAAVAELTSAGPHGSLSLSRAGGGRFLDGRISDSGAPVLHVGEKGGVWLGTGRSGTGFVVARRADNTDAVAIGAMGGGAPGVRILDAAGTNALSELSGDGSGSTLLVGAPGGGKAALKVGATAAAADAFVSIGRGAGGHVVRVSDADGSEVATMGEARVGGGVFVASDGTGKVRMLMSGQGELHAVDAAGVTRATVTSEGALSVRNSSNTTVVRIAGSGGGNGMLQITNSGGNAMVEAGVLPTSEGVVRAYPLGGPPGTMIGMPGTMIKGWTGAGK